MLEDNENKKDKSNFKLIQMNAINHMTQFVSENRFKQDDLSGEFKVSTWNKEVGEREGVGDFTLLVINDANDPEHTTYFIDNYIRLMTNTGNYHYMGDKSGYYRIVVTPCRYNSTTQKFELRSDVEVTTEQTRIEIEVNLSWYLCGGGDELGIGIVKTDGEVGHTIEHLPDR